MILRITTINSCFRSIIIHFRYLSSLPILQGPIIAEPTAISTFESECTLWGKRLHYRESDRAIEVSRNGEIRYRWVKGNDWPELATPEFWMK